MFLGAELGETSPLGASSSRLSKISCSRVSAYFRAIRPFGSLVAHPAGAVVTDLKQSSGKGWGYGPPAG